MSRSVADPRRARSDIVETEVSAGNFRTLSTAVVAGGLLEILTSPGPFTVFAPTDEAFGKLLPGALQRLLEDLPNLKSVLAYHVLDKRVGAGGAIAPTRRVQEVRVPTVRGVPVRFDSEGLVRKRVPVNYAPVATPTSRRRAESST